MFDEILVDLTDVEVNSSSLLPKGEYAVTVSGAEVKDTFSGTGNYLQVNFKVMEGDRKGSYLKDIFNLNNPNPVAVKIGQERLKKLMIAAGKTNFVLSTPDDLVGLRVLASVDVKKRDGYKDINDVKEYSKLANTDGEQDEIPF